MEGRQTFELIERDEHQHFLVTLVLMMQTRIVDDEE